jgi:hypothetical protein
MERATTGRSRRLATHRGFNEYEVFLIDRTRAGNPPRCHDPVYCLRGNESVTKEGILFLTVPCWNVVGVPLEAGKTSIRPQSAYAKMVGYSIARAEVPASRILRIPHRRHVRRGDSRFHVHTVRPGRRCQDAEFLPRHRANSGSCHRLAGVALYADPELLVPVSLSVWSPAWNRIAAQSSKDPSRRRGLHRLRKMRAGLSFQSGR